MPMRGELVVPAMRSGSGAEIDNGAWIVVGFCALGWLVSIYFAASYPSIDGIPDLMAQFPYG
jgi:hypothetical protein